MDSNRIFSFKDDYSEGCHPSIMDALQRCNIGQEEGYGLDRYCQAASAKIREIIDQPNSDVHFVSGGTQANSLVLSSILKPYESVISAASGHIAIHETGAIEASGHKIHAVTAPDGKLNPELIRQVKDLHVDEHMVVPRVVYISQSTEYGTLYSKDELSRISKYCKEVGLYLFLDGARLGPALTSCVNDLSLRELSDLVDVFYIGGTKNGAWMGEAIVIVNADLQANFRYIMKQKGALLAKSRILGIQFRELFREDLFFRLGKIANDRAQQLATGISEAGYKFWTHPDSNQIFPILPVPIIRHLKGKYDFYDWADLENDLAVIRLVTSWATPEAIIWEFLGDLK